MKRLSLIVMSFVIVLMTANSLNGWYSRNLQFSVGKEHTGTISGLKKGGKYSVEIINNDYLEYGQNLVGSGTIES